MERPEHNPGKEEAKQAEQIKDILGRFAESIAYYRSVQTGLSEMESDVSEADEYVKNILRGDIAGLKEEMTAVTGREDFALRFMFGRDISCRSIKGRGIEFSRRYFNAHEVEPAGGGAIKLTDAIESTELVLPPEEEFVLVLARADYGL